MADENGVPVDDFPSATATPRRPQVPHLHAGHLDGLAPSSRRRGADHRPLRPVDSAGQGAQPGHRPPDPRGVAIDHACPAGGVEIYTDEGRTAGWNAVCDGTTDENGLYGKGIVNAANAVKTSRNRLL